MAPARTVAQPGGRFAVEWCEGPDQPPHVIQPLLHEEDADIMCDMINIKQAKELGSLSLASQQGVPSSLLDMDEGVRSALDGFSHAQLAQQLQDCASRLFSQPGLRRAGLPPRARLLFAAADGGDTAVLQLMLLLLGPEEAAAAVDASSSTALHYAARQGQHGAVRLLLAHSTREAACARNREGSTPLALAAAGGHGEAVQALLGAAREAVATADGQQRMPLALAARGGHAHVMRLLLAAVPPEAVPALVARCDAHRYTPLHEACSQHYATAVSLLLDAAGDTAGALCKMQTRPSGFTPLHLAVRLTLRTVPEASAAVAQLLVAACPLACMTADAQGMLPLHRSVLDANTAVLPLLLEAGPEAATEAAPQHGTPLEMALATKRPHIARCLLAAGPAAHVFNILLSAACAPAVRRSLLPDAIVARMPLSEADWALVPFRHKTEGLGRALPAAMELSMEQASQLVRRLTRGDAMRLRFFALVLSRQQRRVGVPLPKYVVWRILSQFA